MSEFLVISCSLNPESNSRVLSQVAFDALAVDQDVSWIDLRDLQLPVCDGKHAYGHKAVAALSTSIKEAKCVLVGTPVYNYNVSASLKNLVELTGRAWNDKLVGFLCAAGGRASYMSVMSLANSLMLDFRCLIIPRFVYADGEMFSNGSVKDKEVSQRIEELVKTAGRLTKSLEMI